MPTQMISGLKPPASIPDAIRLLYLSLYESLGGLASVAEREGEVEIAWSDECLETSPNGVLVFMTHEQHMAYREARRTTHDSKESL